VEQNLTIWDLFLTPVYLIILSTLAKKQRDKRYPPGHPLRPFYLKGLYLKFFGAIMIGLVYQFYYKGGDTFNFYDHAEIINSSLERSIGIWFKLLTHQSPMGSPEIYNYSAPMVFYNDRSSYAVCIIAAILGLFNGTTYMPIALLFAYISYTGIWAMYRTFVDVYPIFYKELALAFLFVPSTFVWGSAIFKDTVCMFGLGWIVYSTFRIFIHRDLSVKNFVTLAFSFYLIAIIKVYILLSFLPALGLWLLMTYSKKVKSAAIRWVLNLSFIAIIIAGFFFAVKRFEEELSDYSLDKIAEKAQRTQEWITYISDATAGSTYNLGAFEPTPMGMLSKFPAAVTVTLFRPFIWEVNKPIVLLSGLEAFAFLFMTLSILFKRGPFAMMKRIITDRTLVFFLIFTLIFAFAVGISTGNFGTLSRYKIPCMPFFAAFLLILYSKKDSLPIKKAPVHAPFTERKIHHLT
jgi:hypothetical protein